MLMKCNLQWIVLFGPALGQELRTAWQYITMEIPEVAKNHPQRVFVMRTSSWAGDSDWEDAPIATRCRDGRNTLWELWRTTSHFWSLIEDNLYIPHKESVSSPTQLPRNNPATVLESLKAPSDILSQTLHIMKILYLLLYNLTLLKKRSGISPKSSCPLSH